jgi:anti-sigma B factor antagonist
MLVRAQRRNQALLAYGLSDHYRHILHLTRLDDTIAMHGSESEALAAARL